jgi:hypothetical protein
MTVPGVREETMVQVRYKVSGSAAYDRHVIGASPWRSQRHGCEPASEHGPGFVGDSGERREPHPV